MKFILRYKNSLIALLVYLVVSIIYTYPLIFNFTKQVVGRGGDVFQTIADSNSFYEYFRSLGYLRSLWYAVSHFSLDPVFLNTYFQFLFGQPAGYNLFWLFSFIAAGFGVYLLVKYIFDNLGYKGFAASASAFIAGVIYSFSPAHFAWGMGFRGATHIEWIPFTTLFLIKFIKKPSAKYFLSLVVFFTLLIMGESHFAVYYIVFLIPLLIYYLSQNKPVLKNKLFIRYALLAIVFGVIVVSLFYLPLLRISVSGNNYLNPGIEQTIKYSPDILSIIVPTEFHPFWANNFAPIRETFTGNATNYSNYLGITALCLLVISLFRAQQGKIKEIYFWCLTALSFFILSLGPYLHYLGTIEPKIPLPFLLIYRFVPFFDNIREVGRIWVIALLCFSVATAFGMQYLFSYVSRKSKVLPAAAMVIIFSALSLEYLAIPVSFSSLQYPPFYDQLKKDAGDFYVADIPGSSNYEADAKTRYYASIHHKKLISGLDPARDIPGNWNLQRNTPVLSEILYTLPKGKTTSYDIINHNYRSLANKIFSKNNIPYIIIQKEFVGFGQDYIKPYDLEKLKNFIKVNFTLENTYEDQYLIAYKVKKVSPKNFLYLSIGNGWEKRNTEKNSRQFINEASLNVHNFYATNKTLSLSLDMSSPYNEFRTISFYLNHKFVGKFFSYAKSVPVQVAIPDVPPGESEIEMRLNDYGQTNSALAVIENINYAITRNTGSPNDFQLLDNSADTTVAFVPLYSPYNIQKVQAKNTPIFGHPILSPEDVIIWNRSGNQALLRFLPLLEELFIADAMQYFELEADRDIRETQYYKDNISNIIAEKNIGYIFADKKLLNKKERLKLSNHLRRYIPYLSVSESKNFTIFSLPPSVRNNSVPFVFGSGWDILENKLGQSKRRKINTSASLNLFTQTEQKIVLSFKSRTCPNTTTYGSVNINNNQNLPFTLTGDNYEEIKLTTDQPLDYGLNILTINVNKNTAPEASDCPIWVSDISVYGVD